MEQLTQEEIRDGLLSLYEENEERLSLYISEVEKIENDAIIHFEMKVITAKNNLVHDATISDDDLQQKYLEEVEAIKKTVLGDTNRLLQILVEKIERK